MRSRLATHYPTLQHTATHYNTLQHTATHLNTQQHHATHSAALFGYEGPVQVSSNTVPPISAPKKKKMNAGMRADVSTWTEEDECVMALRYVVMCCSVLQCEVVCCKSKPRIKNCLQYIKSDICIIKRHTYVTSYAPYMLSKEPYSQIVPICHQIMMAKRDDLMISICIKNSLDVLK